MNGACLCGRVSIRVPGRPTYLNACNCTFCTKLGAMWGYFPADAVTIEGSPRSYVRTDLEDPHLSANFCETCGSTTHWAYLSDHGAPQIGVNMRLFPPEDLVGVELRFGDRRNYGLAPRHYYREPTIFDGAGATA